MIKKEPRRLPPGFFFDSWNLQRRNGLPDHNGEIDEVPFRFDDNRRGGQRRAVCGRTISLGCGGDSGDIHIAIQRISRDGHFDGEGRTGSGGKRNAGLRQNSCPDPGGTQIEGVYHIASVGNRQRVDHRRSSICRSHLVTGEVYAEALINNRQGYWNGDERGDRVVAGDA